MSGTLPKEFSHLNKYLDHWIAAEPNRQARHTMRLNKTYDELKEFYDAMLPHMEAIMEHLDRYTMDKMPEAEKTLMELAHSFMEIATAVELFHGPTIRTFDPTRVVVHL